MPDPRSTTPPERPRTPASQPPTVSEHRAVTSTPFKSGGSGVLTGRSKKQTIENIRRFYKYDLEHNSEDVSIEDFLLFLLGHALHSEDRVVVAKRLQELYSLALEMCNVDDGSNSGLSHLTDSNSGTKDDTEEGRHKAAWYSREFKQCLQKYRSVDKDERNMYQPFTQLANTILAAWDLHEHVLEDVMKLRRPDAAQSLILQRNDPKCMSSSHATSDGHLLHDDTQRSPDLIALSLENAIKTSKNPVPTPPTPDDWARHAKIAPKTSDHAPDFSEVRMCWEFKLDGKVEMPPVPVSFSARTLSACESLPPLSLYSNNPEAPLVPPPPVKPSQTQSSRTSTPASRASNRSSSKRQASSMGDPEGSAKAPKAPRRDLKTGSQRDSVAEEYPTLPAFPTENDSGKLPASIQSAIYAAERLCASPFFTHALNAAVTNQRLWLLWYERGGCVRARSLDFFADLPWFMVLLVILKYFDSEAWGECPETFSQLENGTLKFTLGTTEFSTKGWTPSRLLLFGRGTIMAPVTDTSGNLDENNPFRGQELVAKVSWPEERRYAEDDLLDYAYAIGNKPEARRAVRGHLPTLVASGSFCTKDCPIVKRKESFLGLTHDETKSKFTWRCLRILVFIKLKPIRGLKGLDLMTVWLDCFRCHFQLWKWGLHHRDISPNNLMYYVTEQGRIVGVLNDFDLAVLASSAAQSSKERTGTLPYMANKLLKSRGGPIAHLYEYDVESFIYVLLWFASRYDEGYDTAATQYLGKWQDDDPAHIIVAHENTFENLPKDPENQDYGEYTTTIVNLSGVIFWIMLSMARRRHAEDYRHEAKADLTNTQYITEVNVQLEQETEKDESINGLATRELDLSKAVEEMDVRGRNSRLMAEELQKQKPELASAV